RRDLVPGVLSALGYDKVFHKVSQQPGMPLFFAVKGEQLAFGLPGTPLGCHLGFHRYVSAAIRKRIGLPRERPMHKGRLSTGLVTRGSRTLFRLALVELEPGGWTITPLGWRGSSDLMGTARANSYLRFPPGEHSFTAGQALEFELLSGAGEALHG
ncbi:MAG: hypothetical protein RBU30_25870, partial [Polyangia bacterium]|nr:hypothetical protein [Polyangia bacterium]